MSTTDHPNWCNRENCKGTFHMSDAPLMSTRDGHVAAAAESEADGPAALRLSVNLSDAYARISLDSDNARVLAERLIELADLIDVDDANVLEDCARECAAAYGHLATVWTQFADEVADAIEHATAEYDPATDYPEPEDDWEMAR